MLYSKEHYDLMESFEREFSHYRLNKEAKEMWPREAIYQDGQANALFLAYRRGYALGKTQA